VAKAKDQVDSVESKPLVQLPGAEVIRITHPKHPDVGPVECGDWQLEEFLAAGWERVV
jgi:hypothetical protein